jgi:MATE family multidrug resistance protein
VVPSCVGSAAEYRVAYQLSKGNIEVAKQMSNMSMVVTGITSLVGTAIMFAFRHPLIRVITNDDDLFEMLMGVMPYLLLCQPLISLTTTGAYLNRALAMYQRSTKIELLITCLVTLPAAWVSTFIYGWDISGLTAASFVGYATMGAVILAIYNNADWEKAVRKNRKMAGTVESSKLGCEDTKKPELIFA